jgi:hypothetical protein
MIVRFFKNVNIVLITTIILDDDSIDIKEDTITPLLGKIYNIDEIIPTLDDRYIDIILLSKDNESKILKNVDTLTCSITKMGSSTSPITKENPQEKPCGC